eukprot:CAMPEP_0177789206 /NCGR_PEP_ID=MMETSP0491_2-20121128/22606_1 /TAXON_ID=63592 /ORGANISM="Tetraselmis chuii, Strain PLY429" /LENGTH=153 /DNA_ID=CAMNT_0019311015 /DNA_START=196 /DNA_END=653 /DNA_ORIENTATION=+
MATRPAASVTGKPQAVSRLVSRKAGSRPAGGLRAVRLATSASEQPTDNERKVHQNLVHQLLERAASRRERGETFCLHCKGTGAVTCQTCQGAGVLEPEKVKVNVMRRAGYVIKNAVGQLRGNPPGKGFNMKITNRCRACRGTGTTECLFCNGL